jgi:hypothetical protein
MISQGSPSCYDSAMRSLGFALPTKKELPLIDKSEQVLHFEERKAVAV